MMPFLEIALANGPYDMRLYSTWIRMILGFRYTRTELYYTFPSSFVYTETSKYFSFYIKLIGEYNITYKYIVDWRGAHEVALSSEYRKEMNEKE